MKKIWRGDKVVVMRGRAKGQSGTVVDFKEKDGKKYVIIEGVNLVAKFVKAQREGQKGGITYIPAPVHISNIMLICPSCGKPTRVKIVQIQQDGKKMKMRACKHCRATFLQYNKTAEAAVMDKKEGQQKESKI